MVKNKKGMFFTLIGIMIVTLLLVYVTARYGDKLSDRFPTENMRVNQVTNLVNDMESKYLPAAISAVSQEALEAMADYAATYSIAFSQETPYLPGTFRREFNETVLENKIARLSEFRPVITTFPVHLDILKAAIETAYRVDMEYEILNLIINQEEAFMLNVTAIMNYTIAAKEGGIKYNRSVNSTARISIINLRDPWYAYRAGIDNPIWRAADISSDAAGVQALLDAGNYTPDSDGLSYLERFVGVEDRGPGGLNPDKFGMVSYVSEIKFGAPLPLDASQADYTFHPWGGTCAGNVLYDITDITGVAILRINLHFVQRLGVFGISRKLVDGMGDPSPPCQSG